MGLVFYSYKWPYINGVNIETPLEKDGLRMIVNTKDLIGWEIFFFGAYEPHTNTVLKKYVRPGDVVIEGGSHIGTETLILSRLVGDTGHVYGFEPTTTSFHSLNENIKLNGLTNISTYELALGEKNGAVGFCLLPPWHCNPGRNGKVVRSDEIIKTTVNQTTIDTFVQENNLTKVNFLKMDIQGGEMDLLDGAHETLSRFHPIIFTEASPKYNDLPKLYEKLKSYGYAIYRIKGDKKTVVNSVSDIKNGGDWLAKVE